MARKFQVLYDYSDVPTLKKFALDNSRVRMAMGPFGCVCNYTEFLSAAGWKRISEYSDGDQVAQFSPETGEVEFIKPDGYIVLPCEQFYSFRGLGIDMMLSAEHRMLWYEGDKYETTLSYESAKEHWERPISGEIPNTFKIKDRGGLKWSEAEIRLQVAVIAEGSFHKDNTAENLYCSVGFVKERKKHRLEYLLELNKCEYKKTDYEDGRTYYYFQAPVKIKKFDSRFFCMDNAQIKIVLEELRQWDFHYSNGNTFQYSTTEKESADFIQYCFATQGIAVNVTERDRGGVRKPLYRLNVNPVNRKNVLYQSPDAVSLVNYGNGFKYCFKTKTGFFVARRNGKIFVTGNSGKSSACVMEIIRRGNEQKASPDGIRRTRWAVVRNCYSDDTEILTEKRGWQLFKDLLPDDKVASLVDDHLVFKLPNKVVSFPYKGDMIGFENEGVNFLVTPEHKMWVSTRRTRKKVWGNYEIKTAEEIYGNQTVRVKRNAKWKVTRKNDNLALFEWIGFWVAEGHANEYRYGKRKVLRCAITQKDNLGYVRSLFSGAGIPYRESKAKCGVSIFTVKINEMTKALIRELIPLGKACSKTVPKWIKESTSQQISSFIKGYLAGDGQHSKDGSVRASTGSKQLADDIQELALRAGMVVNISVQDHIGRESKINGITCRTNTLTYILTFLCPHKYNPILYVNKKTTNKLIGWHKKPYDGYVYCVEMEEVPVYVRRKGKGFWCVRSYNQLKDTTIKTFHDWFPPIIFGDYRITDHTYIITKFPGVHIEVLFRALDRPDQVSNLLSLELTGAWFNEVREIPKSIIEAMDGRIGRYPSGRDGGASWYGIIMDTNPPDEDSYLYKMFEKVRPDNWAIFKQPSGLSVHAENTKYLPKGYYTNLAKGKDEMYKRIYIDGQYGYFVSGKPVFTSFVDNIHIARSPLEPKKGLDVIVGFDFGLTPACVIGQITPLGQLMILDELVSDGMGLKQFCENQLLPLLRRKYFGMRVMGFGDPSGVSRAPTDESTCFEILQGQEVGLRDVVPCFTNAITARVGAVEAFLNKMYQGEPGFILSPNCHFLRKAMNGGYHYEKDPKSTSEEFKPMPTKNFSSHICDALQYLCLYIDEKGANEKKWKSFASQLKARDYQPGINVAGY